MPVHLLRSLLDGYLSADGHFNAKTKSYTAGTVSRQLAHDIIECVERAYHRPASISFVKKEGTPKETKIIEGRTVNQKDAYTVTFKLCKSDKDHSFYADGYIWYPIRKIQ